MKGFIKYENGPSEQQIVSVISKQDLEGLHGEDGEMSDDQKADNFSMIPREGNLVYGRINKVEDRFARVDILAIEERPL